MMLTAAELALQFDPDTRALWHLELLGCYAPDDAIAPYLPPPARTPHDDCDDWDAMTYPPRERTDTMTLSPPCSGSTLLRRYFNARLHRFTTRITESL